MTTLNLGKFTLEDDQQNSRLKIIANDTNNEFYLHEDGTIEGAELNVTDADIGKLISALDVNGQDLTGLGSVSTDKTLADNLTIEQDNISGISTHKAQKLTVSSGSYGVVFDIASGREIIFGSIYGHQPEQLRLTWDDGTTDTLFDQSNSLGVDQSGDNIGVLPVPPADNVKKLEFYNASTSSEDYGFKVVTRA